MSRIWITRSEPSASKLGELLSTGNMQTLIRPVIEIEDVDQWRDVCLPDMPPWVVIVTSQHAALRYLKTPLVQDVLHIALGQATKDILSHARLQVSLPTQGSSEAVVAMPIFSDLPANSVIWLVAGVGGREILQEQLAKRHFTTLKFEFYRRVAANLDDFQEPFDVVEISSQTALDGVRHHMSYYRVGNAVPSPILVVASERLAKQARSDGFNQIVCAPSAEIGDVVATIREVSNRKVSNRKVSK